MEAQSQGPANVTSYENLYDYTSAFITFLTNLAQTVNETNQLDIVHINELIEQAMKFATRIQKEQVVSDLVGKMERLKRVVELQCNQTRKIGEDLAGLGKSLNTPNPKRSARSSLPQITSPFPQPPTSVYNKDHRILVKIEPKAGSILLWVKSSEELTDIINAQLKKSRATDTDIRMAKILQSGNLSSNVEDNEEVEKLQGNLDWAQALGEASIITKSFGVVAHGVSSHRIDMKNKDSTIQYMIRKNKNAFLNLTISWIGWLKTPVGDKATGSLIIE